MSARATLLEHTEDRYEVIRGVEVVDVEYQTRSNATRWYTQQQAADLFSVAGFEDVHAVSAFTDHSATAADAIFAVFGRRPVAGQREKRPGSVLGGKSAIGVG